MHDISPTVRRNLGSAAGSTGMISRCYLIRGRIRCVSQYLDIESAGMVGRFGMVSNGRVETINKALVAELLGLFWLLDGILQIQPQSFTSAFVSNILQPNLPGQPSFLVPLLNFGIYLFSINTVITNLGSGLIQILIGIVLLFFRYDKLISKIALVTSVIWGLVVWIFGEGLGVMLTGMGNFYTGAPGSVMIYMITAVFLLFPEYLNSRNLVMSASAVFVLGGILALQPTFWTSAGISSIFTASSDSISFISQPATIVSSIFSANPIFGNIILTVFLFGFGALLYLYAKKIYTKKAIIYIAIIFLLLVWWLGMDFGGVQTFPYGTATDPNSAVVLAMLMLYPVLLSKGANV